MTAGDATPRVVLDWNPSSGAAGYKVKRATSAGGPYTTIANLGATNWITLYLQKSLGFATLISTSGLSVLWLGLLIGRFANSRLALVFASGELVLWSGIGGLATGLLLLTSKTPVISYFWLLALGLCMSGIYPNIMAELNGRNPARMGLITGFLAQAAGLGTLIAQPVMGVVAQQVSLPVLIRMQHEFHIRILRANQARLDFHQRDRLTALPDDQTACLFLPDGKVADRWSEPGKPRD